MHLTTVKPGPDGLVRLALAGGALIEAPIWEEHHRGTNYMAVISVEPAMPGGLGRYFIDKGKGDCLYIVEQVAALDAVEFAADYTTSVGRRQRERWYGVVLSKTDAEMVLQPATSGVKAVLHAKHLRDERDRPPPVQTATLAAEEPKP